MSLPEFPSDSPNRASVVGIVLFASDGTPRAVPLTNAGFRANSLGPLTAPLRIALRAVYERLEVPWTPPSIPLQMIAPIVGFGWLVAICAVWLVVMFPVALMPRRSDALVSSSIFYGMVVALLVATVIGIRKLHRSVRDLRQFRSTAKPR